MFDSAPSLAPPSCSCIGSWDALNNVTAAVLDLGEGAFCRNLTFTNTPFKPLSEDQTSCVPLDFGTSCQDWWSDVFSDCTDDWCQNEWCFVDPNSCQYKHFSASIEQVDGAFLSYGSCGNLGAYETDTLFDWLNGETIRIAFPETSQDGGHLTVDKDGNVDGASVEFLKQILFDIYQMNVKVHNISVASRERFVSPFTACVHDVALGYVDLCVGPFYRTSERLILSRFSTTFDKEAVILVTNNSTDFSSSTFWGYFVTPLTPIDWKAWIAIILVTIYMELALRVVHRSLENKRVQHPVKEVGNASFNGVLSLTSGSVANVPERTSAGEKFIVGGFAIFAFIFMSAYTASFTLKLITSSSDDTTSSMRTIVDNGGKICVLESIRDTMLNSYDFLDQDSLILTPDYLEISEGLLNNDCWGGILPEFVHKEYLGTVLNYCNTVSIAGVSLLEFDLGMPVSSRFVDAINYLMRVAVNLDLYDDLLADYESGLLDPDLCAAGTSERRLMLESRSLKSSSVSASTTASSSDDDPSDDDSLEGTTMTLDEMVLPILVSFVGTTVGLLLFLFKKYRNKIYIKGLIKRQTNLWEDQHLHWAIESFSTEVMIGILEKSDRIPVTDLHDAIDGLPNRVLLERLMCKHAWSDPDFREALESLHPQSVSSLYKSLINKGEKVREEATKALLLATPKDYLIALSLQCYICPPDEKLQKNLAVQTLVGSSSKKRGHGSKRLVQSKSLSQSERRRIFEEAAGHITPKETVR